MGSLHLFLSCKAAAALASMLLFICCVHLHSTLEREGEREGARELARGWVRILEVTSLLPGEGRVEVLLPPLQGELLLEGRGEGGRQVVEVWYRGELLLSSLLPMRVGEGFFREHLSPPCALLVTRRENLLLLDGG
ncbi:MAG: hypothetical protein QXM46_02460 [Candidatus Hadarchaeales archaeon]